MLHRNNSTARHRQIQRSCVCQQLVRLGMTAVGAHILTHQWPVLDWLGWMDVIGHGQGQIGCACRWLARNDRATRDSNWDHEQVRCTLQLVFKVDHLSRRDLQEHEVQPRAFSWMLHM